MNSYEFGEYLKSLRKKQKLSMRQLENLSGVSNSYISQIESGERGVPSPEILKKLFRPLRVTYSDIMDKAGYLPASLLIENAYVGDDIEDQIAIDKMRKYPNLFRKFIDESGIEGLESVADPYELFENITPDQRMYFAMRVLEYDAGRDVSYPYTPRKEFKKIDFASFTDLELTDSADIYGYNFYVDNKRISEKEFNKMINYIRFERQNQDTEE